MDKFKLIAVDLDGTLLNSQAEISDKNLSAIAKLNDSGVYFVPCTGRTYSEIPEPLKNNEDVRYIIYSNGAVIFDTKTEKRYFNSISKGKTKEIYDVLSNYKAHITIRQNGNCCVRKEVLDEGNISYYNIWSAHVDVIEKYGVLVEDFETWKYTLDNTEVISIFFHSEEERQDCIKRIEALGDLLVVSVAPFNIEIISKNAGKGNAIINLANKLGIDISKTAGLGDSGNDLPMMKVVGIPIAVSNGTQELKNVCKEIICSNDEDAIDYIYNNFIK